MLKVRYVLSSRCVCYFLWFDTRDSFDNNILTFFLYRVNLISFPVLCPLLSLTSTLYCSAFNSLTRLWFDTRFLQQHYSNLSFIRSQSYELCRFLFTAEPRNAIHNLLPHYRVQFLLFSTIMFLSQGICPFSLLLTCNNAQVLPCLDILFWTHSCVSVPGESQEEAVRVPARLNVAK